MEWKTDTVGEVEVIERDRELGRAITKKRNNVEYSRVRSANVIVVSEKRRRTRSPSPPSPLLIK